MGEICRKEGRREGGRECEEGSGEIMGRGRKMKEEERERVSQFK